MKIVLTGRKEKFGSICTISVFCFVVFITGFSPVFASEETLKQVCWMPINQIQCIKFPIDADLQNLKEEAPILVIPNAIYFNSSKQVALNFETSAFDQNEFPLKVQCDKESGYEFNVGITIVKCSTNDWQGTEVVGSFEVHVRDEYGQVPSWLKKNAEWWTSKTISDEEFFGGINYLITKKIILVPMKNISNSTNDYDVPVWVKLNSQKWAHNEVSDDEFLLGVQWLMYKGILKIDQGIKF